MVITAYKTLSHTMPTYRPTPTEGEFLTLAVKSQAFIQPTARYHGNISSSLLGRKGHRPPERVHQAGCIQLRRSRRSE